jgi:clan AA aspartic protease
MGMVHAEITLRNAVDGSQVRKGLISEEKARSITVNAVVDTGASSIVINEELRQKLGLAITRQRSVKVADGRQVPCKYTEAVEILWKDRDFACTAVVIPGAEHVLLGAIALEGMDLMVNPTTQELIGVHGDNVEHMAL